MRRRPFCGRKGEVMATDTKPAYRIETAEQADWALEKIRAAQADVDEAQRLRDAAVARADAFLDRQTADARGTVEHFTVHLRRWWEPLATAKVKSKTLPNGRVGFRAGRDRVEVTDEEAAISHANRDGLGIIRLTESIDKTAVAAYIKATGEIPDGCDMRTGDPTFYATPSS